MTQSRRETVAPETKQQDTASPPAQLTLMESFASGAVAGGVEVSVNHPFWSLKTRAQRHQPLTFNPWVLYRGFGPNVASMVPISALQVGFNTGIQHVVFGGATELSDYQRLTSSFVAGIASSAVSCPTEMIMTTQGKNKNVSFYQAGNYLVNQAGISCLYTGWLATAFREGMFTSSYLALTPIFKRFYEPLIEDKTRVALASGITAGLCGSVASQVVDTVKTIQQDADPLQPVSPMQALKISHKRNGVLGIFKWGLFRTARVASAVYIMGEVTEAVESRFTKK
jgi:hypothetical protein